MDCEAVICTEQLRKRYGRHVALDGLDLTVTRGEVFGFLGPNGAGKSTTIRILLGLLRPSAGRARILDRPAGTVASRANGRVGALVEEPAFYEYLSGRRNLELLAALSSPVDHKRIDEVLELVGLRERQKDRVGAYSHGMKQRLGIAQALIPRPELLVLDEPASGLDPQGVVEVRDLIQRVNTTENVTVFVSSHHLHEIELTCTDAAIINKGKLVVRDKLKHLLSGSETAVAIEVDDPARAQAVLAQTWDDLAMQQVDGLLRVTTGGDRIADINAALVGAGLRVSGLQRERPSLEDLYLRMMR